MGGSAQVRCADARTYVSSAAGLRGAGLDCPCGGKPDWEYVHLGFKRVSCWALVTSPQTNLWL